MPTQRIRHMITESDELSACLDKAAKLWPEYADERAELLRQVIALGRQVVETRSQNTLNNRLEALKRLSENFSGTWPADFDEQRKSEWPA